MKSSKIVSTLLFFFLIGISSVQSQNNELMQNLTKEQQNLVKQQLLPLYWIAKEIGSYFAGATAVFQPRSK